MILYCIQDPRPPLLIVGTLLTANNSIYFLSISYVVDCKQTCQTRWSLNSWRRFVDQRTTCCVKWGLRDVQWPPPPHSHPHPELKKKRAHSPTVYLWHIDPTVLILLTQTTDLIDTYLHVHSKNLWINRRNPLHTIYCSVFSILRVPTIDNGLILSLIKIVCCFLQNIIIN